MPKLTVCIPVTPGMPAPTYLAQRLLAKPDTSVELIVAPYGNTCDDATELHALASEDKRLRILPPAPDNISAAQLWLGTVAAATGDWITLLQPLDMLEPDLPNLLVYLDKTQPNLDALGWNAFQINPAAPRHIKTTVAVPILHNVSEMDKTKLLDAYFQWSGSQQVPRMPFGLYHGAIKRSLLETILSTCGPMSWLTPIPHHEWAARVLIFSDAMGLSNRPLSAVSTTPFKSGSTRSALEGFPFHAGLGLTAAIAEVQARVLAELGSSWSGFNEHFIRACMYDCVLEHQSAAFEPKCQAYFTAILQMPGGQQLVQDFKPQFMPQMPDDPRRGLHGKTLLIDRFIGNAVTAQEFFNVVRSMIAPVPIMTGQLELLAEEATAGMGCAA